MCTITIWRCSLNYAKKALHIGTNLKLKENKVEWMQLKPRLCNFLTLYQHNWRCMQIFSKNLSQTQNLFLDYFVSFSNFLLSLNPTQHGSIWVKLDFISFFCFVIWHLFSDGIIQSFVINEHFTYIHAYSLDVISVRKLWQKNTPYHPRDICKRKTILLDLITS